MPRIVTGQISYASAVRDTTDETYTHGNRAYFGSEGGASGIDNIYVLYFTPVSGELQDIAESAINELRIRLTLKKKTTTETDSDFIYKVYSADQSWYSPKSLYDIVDGGGEVYIYEWVEFANQLEAQEIVISLSGKAAYYAAQYGFSIASLTLGDITEITAYTMEADVSDRYVVPIVSLANGFGSVVDGKYWHNPANPFTLVVNYEQETGEPIEQIRLTYTSRNGYTRTIYGDIGLNSVDVPDYAWNDLPQNGTLKIDVTSAAGVSAETLEMPFEVALYNVAYTSHTSGAIIKSDVDLVIAWDTGLAPGVPGNNVSKPTGYIRYIWWDDETETTAGTHTTDTSYTIPAETLSGHNAVHVAVAERYGDNVSARDREYAPTLNLYIQQVAGTGNVTVTPLWGDGIWFPRVKVAWESSGQTAYQVKVGDTYDSGPVWGSAKIHRVQKLLDPGVYPVQVRIQDTGGVWSEWTEPVWITVESLGGVANTIRAVAKDSEIEITVTLNEPEMYGDVLLYRDGIMIAQMQAADTVTYTDRSANKTATYFARCVSAVSGAYRQTEEIMVNAVPKTDGMFLEDGTWLPLKYSTKSPKTYSSAVSEETYTKYYAGREYPVTMRTGRKSKELYMSYAEKGTDLADKIETAAGENVIYKNRIGQVIHGTLNGVNSYRGRLATEITFTITQTDHNEEIPYIWTED